MTAQTVKLWNGAEIPLVGLGTWGGWEAKPGEILKAVETAIDVGYRHIDTAYVYGVEHEVGDAINSKLKDGAVKREELFVVSKLWQKFMAPKDVKPMLLSTLKDLKLEYLDLYLIHKPVPYMNQGDIIPKNENGDVLFNHDVQHTDTWKEMEKLVDEGLVKSIGVSNFNHYQVQNILDHCRVKPAVIQFEIHPYLTMTKLVEFCQSKGIHVTASSPFGSPASPEAKLPQEPVLRNPSILAIAQKHNRSSGQIILRYLIQRGLSAVPKSSNPGRIKQNLQVFDFNLSDEQMQTIKSLNMNWRAHPHLWDKGHKDYPFNEVYD